MKGKHMPTREVTVQRFSIISFRPFPEVLSALQSVLGHPDTARFTADMSKARTRTELEEIVRTAIGSSGFMEFTRFNLGAVLRVQNGGQGPQILRLVIGNPLIMSQMAKHVPDAASYAPVTVLIDERADGVHLSYDRMASCLAPYNNAEALKVARELDAKVEALLTAAALSDAMPFGKTA